MAREPREGLSVVVCISILQLTQYVPWRLCVVMPAYRAQDLQCGFVSAIIQSPLQMRRMVHTFQARGCDRHPRLSAPRPVCTAQMVLSLRGRMLRGLG